MSKTKKILTITSLFIFLGMFFVFTNSAHAITYKAQIGFGKISGTMTIGPDSIGLYITEVYKYAVSVVGILASIVLMWGGVRWLTAGGDSSAVDDAKKWIEGALSGLVLVMTSYMILYFVNPDLIKFKSIKIDPIKAPASQATQKSGDNQICTKNDDCQPGFECVASRCLSINPTEGKTCNQGVCFTGLHCYGRIFGQTTGTCYDGSHGDPCYSASDCTTGKCANKSCWNNCTAQDLACYENCKVENILIFCSETDKDCACVNL